MIEQGTPEWYQERCGKITASRFIDVISVLKNGNPSTSRKKYARELAFELLSGVPAHVVNAASLRWGKEVEAYAREAYELHTGNLITQVGFTLCPENPNVGCSPDGFIGDDGGVEIKCPQDEAVHIETLLEGMPEDHIAQVQGNMFVTGRKWWDFISFDPRQAEPYRLFIQRIQRDEKFIENLKASLISFWKEACAMVDGIKQRKAA